MYTPRAFVDPEANRRCVAAALQALPDHDANAIAALMHAREP